MKNNEELKDLAMEWYLRYGEREVRGDRYGLAK